MAIDEKALRVDVALAKRPTIVGRLACERVVRAVPELLDDRNRWRRVAAELQDRLEERQAAQERADAYGEHRRHTAEAARAEETRRQSPFSPPPPEQAPVAEPKPEPPPGAPIASPYVCADGTAESPLEHGRRLDGLRRRLRRPDAPKTICG